MNKKDFIKKNYDIIREHYYAQGRDMGYTKKELKDYFESVKCCTFVGTVEELHEEVNNDITQYFIITRGKDFVIAEMFNGLMYDFI